MLVDLCLPSKHHRYFDCSFLVLCINFLTNLLIRLIILLRFSSWLIWWRRRGLRWRWHLDELGLWEFLIRAIEYSAISSLGCLPLIIKVIFDQSCHFLWKLFISIRLFNILFYYHFITELLQHTTFRLIPILGPFNFHILLFLKLLEIVSFIPFQEH